MSLVLAPNGPVGMAFVLAISRGVEGVEDAKD